MTTNDKLDEVVVKLDRKRSEPRIKLIPFDEIKLEHRAALSG